MRDEARPHLTDSAGRLTIDLGALARNWRDVSALSATAETAAVVKADAYGVGLDAAVRALAIAGCRTFFVARAEEGVCARAAAADAVIYVLDGALPATMPLLAAADLRPVLATVDQVEAYAAFRPSAPKPPAAIHVDTGMNRLGLPLDDARALARRSDLLAAVAPAMAMSHLACSEISGHPKNAEQLELFREVRALFPGLGASLANSGGIALGPDYQFDLVRPGIALYGGQFSQHLSPLRTVLRAEARILQVRQGSGTVGYGAAQTLPEPRRLAVLGAGYGDGYPRRSGSSDERPGARVFLHGAAAPLVGRVSMDLMTVDVTDIPEAQAGDFAELFGTNIPADEVAAFAETISYELFTSVGRRYRREYVA